MLVFLSSGHSETEEKVIFGMAMVMLLIAILTVISLQTAKAEYGRYGYLNTDKIRVSVRVAWILQETPSLAIPLVLLLFTDSIQANSSVNFVLCSLFISHFAQRTLIYPFLIRGGKESPISMFLMAMVFCTYNGYMQGRYLTQYANYPDSWMLDYRFILGVFLFVTGMLINIHSDHILRNLRKPGETGYKIPRGGLFEYVSGANFLGEIIEWMGFAIATWSLPAFAFSLLTSCNIGPRACHHHQYYLEKFENYPKNRKALIPFIL